MLKRLDLLPDELEWQEQVLTRIDAEAVRVAPPVRAVDGRLVVDRLDGLAAHRRATRTHPIAAEPSLIHGDLTGKTAARGRSS